MSVFTSFAGGRLTASITGSSTPVVTSVDMPLAGTEYSYVLPAGCTQFLIKLRNSAVLQVAYVSGDTSTNYLTVPRTCFYAESSLTLPASVTIYFQSPAGSQVAEILTWT